jgi:hypothetical protein
MYQKDWEVVFRQQLWNLLKITPEQIIFRWKLFPKQGFTPAKAIAHLVESDRMCPGLGIVPVGVIMEELKMDMQIQALEAIAQTLRELKEAIAPSHNALGFGAAPKSQIFVFCNRSKGGIWYTLNGQNQPENIEHPGLTGYIRKLEFKQVERRKEETHKLHCHIDAGKYYVLESGSKSHFTKGLLSAIASTPYDELMKPITICPQPSTENGEVLFCNVYQGEHQVFAPYDDKTDWKLLAKTAKDNVRLANGEMITAAPTAAA